MIRRAVVAAFCCSLNAGCATMPVESMDGVSLAAVEERVKCEIGYAYTELSQDNRFPNLSKWAAGLTLSLAVDETGGVTPSTSLLGPFGKISPLDLTATASLNAKRTGLFNIYIAFIEAARHKCDDPRPIPIEGHLGLAEWIIRVFQAQLDVEQRSAELGSNLRGAGFNSKDKSIGYSLDFLLTLSAGATPNFIITNAPTKAAFSIEAKSTHSVDIAMVEMSDGDFRDHFEIKTIPGKVHKLENPDPDKRSLVPFVFEKEPDKTVRVRTGVDVSLGVDTKLRLNAVLQQLNNKLLIQSLRR